MKIKFKKSHKAAEYKGKMLHENHKNKAKAYISILTHKMSHFNNIPTLLLPRKTC